MLQIFKQLFSKDSSTSFYSFYKKMIGWRESDIYPFSYNLPSSITFPPDFWKSVIRIYKETTEDGYERAISLFWTDGELTVTSVVKGDEKSVRSSHGVRVNYTPHPTKREYFRREVVVDGKTVKRTDIYYKKAPKRVSVEYLFNLHTHPPHHSEGDKFYTFFSLQDLHSFISSKAVVTGLVTDRLYLLIRTSDTPAPLPSMTQVDITVDNLKEKLKLGVYEAEFNKPAFKK